MQCKIFLFSIFEIIYWYSKVDGNNGTFFYFAYGSNLLAKRIHYQNPTAVFYNIAKLENYRLDFNMFVESWNGAVATIVKDEGEHVWGALWTIASDQVHMLDNQEGVDRGWYFAKNVTVTTPDGQQIVARTYEETVNSSKIKRDEDLPWERRPSSTYLMTIVLGAIESRLPAEYIGYLYSFPTNKNLASDKNRAMLGYPF